VHVFRSEIFQAAWATTGGLIADSPGVIPIVEDVSNEMA